VLGEPLLHRVHVVGAATVDGARAVAAHDVARALEHEELGGGDAGGPRPREDDAHVGELLAHHLERVDERGEDHHRRAVLVVVEHGDVELALEALLDLEAARGRDVLEVDAAEDGRDGLHDHHDLVHVLGVEAEREGVDAGELLEDERLAFHDRLGCAGADVAQAQHRGAVRHHRDRVLLDGQRVGLLGVVVDGHADPRHPRRVGHGQIVAGLEGMPLSICQVHEECPVGDVHDRDASMRGSSGCVAGASSLAEAMSR
jgi:hypothetical protein